MCPTYPNIHLNPTSPNGMQMIAPVWFVGLQFPEGIRSKKAELNASAYEIDA